MMLGTLIMGVYSFFSIIYLNGEIEDFNNNELSHKEKNLHVLFIQKLLKCLKEDVKNPDCLPENPTDWQ
jgi:hypothetical protein